MNNREMANEVNEIFIGAVDSINKMNDDELVGRMLRLSILCAKEDTRAMVEVALLAFITDNKDT